MKTKKMSLANIQGKLSRTEMKNIMGGLLAPPPCSGSCDYQWKDAQGNTQTTTGTCTPSSAGCYCSSGGGSCSSK